MKSDIRETVKEHYGGIVRQQQSCCGDQDYQSANNYARNIGYAEEDLRNVPEGANLGLGCGNPLALSQIKPGDTVLDLGSGAGFDCFLAAEEVGPEGQVIGVDMTPEMIEKANLNREKSGFKNVEFRAGHIEDLPVDNNSVDMVISNCVINLSPDKPQVFREAFRVLKTGGTLMVSDIVLLRKLPWFIRNKVDAYMSCLAGAALKEEYLSAIRTAGFNGVEVLEERSVGDIFPDNDPLIKKFLRFIPLPYGTIKGLSGRYAESLKVRAVKPSKKTQKFISNQKEAVSA